MVHYKNIQIFYARVCLALSTWSYAAFAKAQVYTGGNIQEGVDEAGQIVGSTNLREKIIDILKTVLSYMALIAVVVIVIAGIRLVVSQGEEEQKEKAKRSILYAIIGLIVILVARAIVEIVASIGA